MMKSILSFRFLLSLIAAISIAMVSSIASAQSQLALEADAKKAYQTLMNKVPAAKMLSKDAVAILVFPKITKAGLVVGGQYGEGVLMKDGKVLGYYSTAGGSYGLQVGAQQFGYAMFFMNDKALDALTATSGFEVGVGPSVVLIDEGMAKSTSSITMKDDVYAFIFGQKGLMAGLGLQGNKISKLNK
jgi:lipid-binding SYLF domain-containing protein